jgi:Phosphopantetheine attachment site
MEKIIAQLWIDVLHLDRVGISDNFFDLGGNSLLMLQVNEKLCAILQRDVAVVTMFQNPTIYCLAQYLTHQPEEKSSFKVTQERVFKQIEARNKQKQLFMKRSRKNH